MASPGALLSLHPYQDLSAKAVVSSSVALVTWRLTALCTTIFFIFVFIKFFFLPASTQGFVWGVKGLKFCNHK